MAESVHTWLMRIYLAGSGAAASLRDDERGAATAEYALILAVVVVALIAVLGNLQHALSARIGDIVEQIQNPSG